MGGSFGRTHLTQKDQAGTPTRLVIRIRTRIRAITIIRIMIRIPSIDVVFRDGTFALDHTMDTTFSLPFSGMKETTPK